MEIENGILSFVKDSEIINGVFMVPEGLTSIGSYAFCGCQSLKSISIPEGLTSIGRYAFYGCQSLESIKLPDSLTSIGYHALLKCESLKPHDKNEIIDEALKLLPNHDGLCACLDEATRSLSLKHKVAISVISSLPKFNREEAMAFGADNENSYWWPIDDKESRKVFLEYLRNSI